MLALADGLTVTLLLEHAIRELRPPVDEADLSRVQRTLREPGTLSSDVWLKRRKDARAKLKGGDPVELAEVVLHGALSASWGLSALLTRASRSSRLARTTSISEHGGCSRKRST